MMHELGAVHRDLKPSQIFCKGTDWFLCDLDMSRVFIVNASEEERSRLSTDPWMIGTAGYFGGHDRTRC
jgi:serine/threonine protein kinase